MGKKVARIYMNYGEVRGKSLHLVRYSNGEGRLFTTEQLLRAGLARRVPSRARTLRLRLGI